MAAVGDIYGGMVGASEAKSQANIANYNAQVQENEAKAVEQKTIMESQDQAAESARKLSTMKANIGASGVVSTEGSPLLAMATQAVEFAKQNQRIGHEGVVQMQRHQTQANLDRTQAKIYKQKAKNIKTASYIKAGTSLLTGFSTPSGPTDAALAKKYGI